MLKGLYFEIFSLVISSTVIGMGASSCQSPLPGERPLEKTLDQGGSSRDFDWMESDGPRLKEWLTAQQKITEAEMKRSPNYEQLRDSIDKRVASAPVFSDLKATKDGYFFYYRAPKSQVSKLSFIKRGDSVFTTIIDPESSPLFANGGNFSYYFPSPSGRFVVIGITEGGSEKSRMRIFDRSKNDFLADEADQTQYPFVRFTENEQGFIYARHDNFESPDPGLKLKNTRVRLHKIGDLAKNDLIVLAPEIYPESPFQQDDFYRMRFLDDTGVAVALATKGTSSPFRFYFKAKKDLQNENVKWQEFIAEREGIQDFTADNSSVFILNTAVAGESRIDRIEFVQTGPKRSLLWSGKGINVVKMEAAKDAVYFIGTEGLKTRLYRIDYKTKKIGITEPDSGVDFTDILASLAGPGCIIESTSYSKPTFYSEYIPNKGLKEIAALQSHEPNVEVELIVDSAKSQDGTAIPIYLVKPKGAKLDVNTPVLLRSYAAYGAITRPTYDRMANEWMEKGGVRAFCLARGGGEFGEQWHKAGQRRNKENSVLDTVACARHLFEKGISNPKKMAFFSGSAGGIIAGSLAVKYPKMFAAIVVDVGMLNLTRNQFRPGGAANISEYGDMNDPGDSVVMKKLDAFENIDGGTEGPAVLCTHGYNDSRVPVWMSAKFVSRLQTIQGRERPAFMRTNFGSGHGFISTRTDRSFLWADIYTFLFAQLGIK